MPIRALIAVGLAAGGLITGSAVELAHHAGASLSSAPIGAGAEARLVSGGVARVIDQPTIVAASMLRGPSLTHQSEHLQVMDSTGLAAGRSGKVAAMTTTSSNESNSSPAPGIIPEPRTSER